jgi:hypothetical protein
MPSCGGSCGLEAARANYLDFYELAPVGFLTIDARGAILQANVELACWGRRWASLISQPVANFVLRERPGALCALHRCIFERGSAGLRTADAAGERGRVWVLVEAGAVRDAAGQLV